MGLKTTLQTAHSALEEKNIPHAIIGGFALAVHNVPRATQDIDLLADGASKELIIEALTKKGFKLIHSSEEVLQFDGVGNLDILLAKRPLSLEMLKNAKPIPSLNINCVSTEDIIGLKIQAYVNNPKRELQDKADIQALVTKNSNVDWDQIKKYADLFQQWDVIKKFKGTK